MIELTLVQHPDEEFFVSADEIACLHQKYSTVQGILIRVDVLDTDQTIVTLKNGKQFAVLESASDIANQVRSNA